MKNVCLGFCIVAAFNLTACGGGGSIIEPVPVSDNPSTPTPAPNPAPTPPSGNFTVLTIGDSYFDSLIPEQQSIPHEISNALQQTVVNKAEGGAMIFNGSDFGADGITDIRDQYVPETWDWVVMDGGGNDLNEKCSCNDCNATMDSLISQDGNVGEIPLLINRMLADGSKVVFMQYPEIPADAQFGFAACDDEFTEMTFRLNQFALNTQHLWLVLASDVVPIGDASYFDDDFVYPTYLKILAFSVRIKGFR